MNQDQVNRDRLLTEVHTNVTNLVQTLSDHVKKDDLIQKEIKADLKFQQKIFYGLIGVWVFVQFALSLNPNFVQTFFKTG